LRSDAPKTCCYITAQKGECVGRKRNFKKKKRSLLADPGTAWSFGSLGAIAKFTRDPDEALSSLAVGPSPDLRPAAY
jgi:hypothetical protein